jgi:predicted DNA-binding transcriptional regulator AlpA
MITNACDDHGVKILSKPMEKLLLKSGEAAQRLGISRTHFYQLNASGELGPMPIKLGSCSLWSAKELDAWVDHHCPAREQWLGLRESSHEMNLRC